MNKFGIRRDSVYHCVYLCQGAGGTGLAADLPTEPEAAGHFVFFCVLYRHIHREMPSQSYATHSYCRFTETGLCFISCLRYLRFGFIPTGFILSKWNVLLRLLSNAVFTVCNHNLLFISCLRYLYALCKCIVQMECFNSIAFECRLNSPDSL